MSKRIQTALLLGLACTLGFSTLAQERDPNEAAGKKKVAKERADGQDASAEIRKASQKYTDAVNEGNADAVLALWADDADYMDESGTQVRGREAIGKMVRANLAREDRGKVAVETQGIRTVRPEVAVEDGTLTITSADGTKESTRFTAVWTKGDDGWQISSVRDLPAISEEPRNAAYDALRELEWLVGSWSHEDDAGSVTLNCRWILNQSYLQVEYAVKGKEGKGMTVEQRIGWDPELGRIRSWIFDSQGGHGDGLWVREGNTWFIDSAGVLPDGGRATALNTLKYVDENSFVWSGKDRQVEGLPLADTEVKFTRKTESAE